ncbi:hypothetical protein AArcSl_2809 [Halalkaliarchaeum desulfuricum]|uniref:DUF7312 domain-containing protein n=1 Tax=Halalkaliarchaeum desulfuricum TaxID=2055893 RepID=A0A343TMV2_9EURY|nr:hypothetical protein [Halalkaliarchaeum desulfuricum]AUX10424.1 hypothetical protein AArcSl_2809 [Halalkaliarchaeum desulfuricum]
MSDRPQDGGGNTHESDEEASEREASDEEASEREASDEEASNVESEWRFEVDEVGPDGVKNEGRSIEPEGIRLEHALFVVLGILTGVGMILATIL